MFTQLTAPQTDWHSYAAMAWPFTLVIEACEAGIESGTFDGSGSDAAAMAFGLWSMAHGMAMLEHTHLGQIEDDFRPIERAAFEAYVKGISS